MTSPPDDTTTDASAIIAALRAERDLALSEKTALAETLAARTAELAKRNAEYSERIEHQAGTVGGNEALTVENQELRAAQAAGLEVLQAMIASPSDTQPVFDLIARQAADLCMVPAATVAMFDGTMLHLATQNGLDPAYASVHATEFPRPVGPDSLMGRTILSRRVEQIEDFDTDPAYGMTRRPGNWSAMAVPLLRYGAPLGVIAVARPAIGRFPDNQVKLLQTFAEQAVIAITSAETYRALQTRTSDLQESLEYQAATSDVLKVISRSSYDLKAVLQALLDTAARLCAADFGALMIRDGDVFRTSAIIPISPEHEAFVRRKVFVPSPHGSVVERTAFARQITHTEDIATLSDYVTSGRGFVVSGTALGVPLFLEGDVVGVFTLHRQRTEPFTDAQIELVSTFADQAAIAIENTRLLTEQREALEQQTATAEVLQVINSSPGDLAPVFKAMLDKAIRLCEAAHGHLLTYDGECFHLAAASREHYVEWARQVGAVRPGPSAPLGRISRGERIVHIADLREEEVYRTSPAFREQADIRGARSQITVGLFKDNTLLGAMIVYRQEVRPFSDKQIALLENFAAQAVIAMENVRLINEQREALEQQTATAEVLQVINASPGDLTPVFDAVLEKAMRLCGAAFGSLYTYDGERFRSAAQRGVPPAYAAYRAQNPPTTTHGGPVAIFETRRPLHVLDLKEQESYRAGNPGVRAMVELGGIRTILTVPLIKDDAFLGVITIYRQEVRAFTDKQISLLENFAAQAVIAMENARLLTETREALEQQTATAEVLEVINSSPGDLGPVFQALLRKAHTLCEASFGALMTYDGERFHAVAHQGTPAPFREFLGSGLLPGPGDPFGLMVEGAAYSHIHDLLEVVARYPGEPLPRAAADLGGIRTLLVVPLRKDSELLGVITAYRQETRPFSDRQIALLQNFAAQAVIAMENTRLLTEQQEALEQQTATAEVLQVINASPGDLAPVFEAMLEKAIRLCKAEFGTLRTWDGDRFHLGAAHGDPELIEWTKRQRPFTPINGNFPLGRIVRGAEIVRITDALLASYQTSSGFGAMAAAIGFRSGIAVALRKDATLHGAISVYRKNEVRPFTDKQIALLQNFAAQAVIAMENARLLDEIRQRQEELRVTFENMGDGVAMFDETQYLAAWNRKFQDILDLPDALLGQRRTYEEHLRFLAARGDFGPGVDTVEQIEELVASTGQPYGYERTRPDGRVIEIRRNPVPDGGFVLIYSDITERKRSEEEIRAARDAAEIALRELRTAQANLIQAEKMASLGQLTAGIAHEIKNPLNFVNNFSALSTELIDELRDVLAPEPLGETARTEVDDLTTLLKGNLEKVVQHGQRADGIVRSMLDHSRGSSGERRIADLNALIDEALNLAYHGARAQDQSFNITLERDFAEGISPIEVNPQDMTRVFLNLFANGFYAVTGRAREGGDARFAPTLRVTTRDTGDAVEVRVRDNGIGIPGDIRDKLFQPFFTTKPTGEGTGLGLSITYDIVTQQHGGSITVDSKVGDYSEFTIRLPRKR